MSSNQMSSSILGRYTNNIPHGRVILSIVLTMGILSSLLLVPPAQAVGVQVVNLDGISIEHPNTHEFILNIYIDANDRVPIEWISFVTTHSGTGVSSIQNYTITGAQLATSGSHVVSQLTPIDQFSGYGYGYLEGYGQDVNAGYGYGKYLVDYGYRYGGDFDGGVAGYGYGYGSYGYGYGEQATSFRATVDSAPLSASGYTLQVVVRTGLSETHEFASTTVSFTVTGATGQGGVGAVGAAPAAAPAAEDAAAPAAEDAAPPPPPAAPPPAAPAAPAAPVLDSSPVILSAAFERSLVSGGSRVLVSVVVSDDTAVQRVTVGDLQLSLAAGTNTMGTWTGTITAQSTDGTVTLPVLVFDSLGQQDRSTVTLRVDATSPSITITTPQQRSVVYTPIILVSGFIDDNVGIRSATINGNTLPLSSGTFSAAVTLNTGSNTISISADDLVGNIALQSISVTLGVVEPAPIVPLPEIQPRPPVAPPPREEAPPVIPRPPAEEAPRPRPSLPPAEEVPAPEAPSNMLLVILLIGTAAIAIAIVVFTRMKK